MEFGINQTDDTGEFLIEQVGEVDGKSFVTHLTVFHPGLKDTLFGFINAAKKDNLVFVVQDSDGQKYLMGDKLRPACRFWNFTKSVL